MNCDNLKSYLLRVSDRKYKMNGNRIENRSIINGLNQNIKQIEWNTWRDERSAVTAKVRHDGKYLDTFLKNDHLDID